jgi:VWFA-related protein
MASHQIVVESACVDLPEIGLGQVNKFRMAWFVALFWVLAGITGQPSAGQLPSGQAPAQTGPPNPMLTQRPPPKAAKPPGPLTPEGHIKLDLVVNDAAGKPVQDLQPWNFKLLDNDAPRKILSFRAFNDSTVKPEPPVEVILVIDTVNLPFPQVAVTRQQIGHFLQENGGHLKQPVTLLLLTDAGLRVQPRPSLDGNALMSVVNQIKGSVRTIDSAMGGEGLLERFQICVHAMSTIAENMARKPGKKLLIWVGPGWPILNRQSLGTYSAKNQQRYFDGIVELSTRLREARMVVYSVAPADVGAGASDISNLMLYQNYLKGVKSARQADTGNLALKVLATQTGGQILGPDNDLAAQIDRCVADANGFYRISFDPPPTDHPDEYHDLNVQVDQPGLKLRTNTGYYNEPPPAESVSH